MTMKLKTVKQKKTSNKKRALKNSNGHMKNIVNITKNDPHQDQ